MRQKLKLFWLNLKVDLTLTPKARKNLIRGLIIGAIALITPILIIAIIVALQPNYPITTDRIEDYGNDEYYFVDKIFMPYLLKNAEVVSYYSYNYWDEDYDLYLELKFNTEDEMDAYLDALFSYVKTKSDAIAYSPVGGDWFVREEHPSDPSFTVCYYKDFHYNQAYQDKTGYRIEDYYYICCYAVICYSYDSLTVIQSASQGSFNMYYNEYTPKFLERFGITYDSPSHEFVIEFDRINKDK